MSYVTDRAKKLGLPVKDGAKPLTLAVTNNDIVNSMKANSKQCALARAAQRIPKVTAAYFFLTTAYLEYGDRFERYLLPPSVQKEIIAFDRARMFAPGIYQLSPPPHLRARRPTSKTPPAPSGKVRNANIGKVIDAESGDLPKLRALVHPKRFVVKTRFVRGLAEPA